MVRLGPFLLVLETSEIVQASPIQANNLTSQSSELRG